MLLDTIPYILLSLPPLIRNYKRALTKPSGFTNSQNVSVNERLSLQSVHSSGLGVTVSMNGEHSTTGQECTVYFSVVQYRI